MIKKIILIAVLYLYGLSSNAAKFKDFDSNRPIWEQYSLLQCYKKINVQCHNQNCTKSISPPVYFEISFDANKLTYKTLGINTEFKISNYNFNRQNSYTPYSIQEFSTDRNMIFRFHYFQINQETGLMPIFEFTELGFLTLPISSPFDIGKVIISFGQCSPN